MVVWVIGLSGSGKTTLSEKIVKDLRARERKVVLLDGDEIRDLFGNDLGHDIDSRRLNAQRICDLSSFLESQEIDVVCAILSIFPESREWCRKHLSNYYEVFIDTPLENLIKRDPKGIYERYKLGKIDNVAGLDLKFIKPKFPNLLIENTGSLDDLLSYSSQISNYICEQ
jgi:adenylylsulfate kinase